MKLFLFSSNLEILKMKSEEKIFIDVLITIFDRCFPAVKFCNTLILIGSFCICKEQQQQKEIVDANTDFIRSLFFSANIFDLKSSTYFIAEFIIIYD